MELIAKGKDLMQKARFAEAEKQFQQVITTNPRSAEAMVSLARIALLRRDISGAQKQLSGALKVTSNDAEAIALQGVIFMTQGKFGEAVEQLEKAKSINPKLEMIYYNLARSYRKLGKMDLAESAARTAIDLNPKNFQAHGELSFILNRKGKTADGIRQMAEALRVNPLFLKGYMVLGEIYKLAGKGNQAIKVYRRGLKYNPTAHVLRQQLCGLYAFKGDFKSAYREAVLLAALRNNYGDYLRLGNYALILGLFEKAEKAFRKSIELNPESWEGHYNLGELYSAAKLVKEAKAEYKAAIARNATNGKPHNGLGTLALFQENDPKEAKRRFQTAMEMLPKNPGPVFNMALACSASKEYSEAEKYAVAAVKLSKPATPIAMQAEKLLETIRQMRG